MAGTLDRHELTAMIGQLEVKIPRLEERARDEEKAARDHRSQARAMTVELAELQQLLKEAEDA